MNPNDFQIRQTEDGSGTLYSSSMQESYHSLNGAIQESKHVFIEAGLKQCLKDRIRIFEVGFGTGLNALLTWSEAKQSKFKVDYTSIEAYPLSVETITKIGYDALDLDLPKDAFFHLHTANWNSNAVLEKECFSLYKILDDFATYKNLSTFDLIYFDAFAPDKQPEMWEEHLFSNLFNALDEHGILVTYCAKGEVRRRLQRCGFTVERIPGPPGKREMIRAIKKTS